MKHIYLINNITCAAIYGIGTYINQIISCLQDEPNLYLTVIYLNHECKYLTIENEESKQIEKIYIPKVPHMNIKRENERYYRNIFYLLKPYINCNHQNIFHFNFTHNAPLLFLIKAQYKHCKIIYAIHYFNWYFTLNGNISKLGSIIEKEKEQLRNDEEKIVYSEFEMDKAIFQVVDRIICLSDVTYSLLAKEYHIEASKLLLIYNGLEDALKPKMTPRIIKEKMLFKQNIKILLYVGRLDNMKGVNSLLYAFQKIVKQASNTHLLIVGDGEYNQYLPLISDIWNKVSFTGRLSKEKLYELYEIADVGIIPSLHEQCSYVLIEMLMFGIPIVGTSIFQNILNARHCVPIESYNNEVAINPDQLASLILEILNMKDIKAIRKNNRKIFIEKYTLNTMKNKIVQCYNSLIIEGEC